ncbi:MAG: right-handed parallel beta-helix repeat-containing protein, partial [Paludibacteraceae bacterium]|nr:right-handed parallel beta-helix repeat-containing protein [Paludibacteraceae bacterium]
YNPIYDASGEESDDPTSLCYRIKNNITIYGGYPADAQIGATADPENHPTVFSGDHKGDDKVVKDVDENGRLKLTYSNRGDNSKQLFEANKCDATFNNVIVDGAASYGIISNGDVTRFYGNNVTFQNCDYAVYYTSDKAVIFIDGSKFENISSGCLYTPSGWNTNVTSTVFSGNTGYIAYSASEGMMSFDRVSVTGNNAHIYSVNTGEFKITNSEFINNDNSGSLIYMNNNGNPYSFLNTKFINNKTPQSIIENNGVVMIVDNCSFKGNESGSYMIRSGAGLIVRHSFVSDNQITSDMFYTNKLTLLSDTIELNKSEYIARLCQYGASIDSCLIKNNDSYLFHSAKSSTDNWRFDLINSDIVDNHKTNSKKNDYVIFAVSDMDTVNIARTKFIGNKYEEASFIYNHNSYFDFYQCEVDSNYDFVFIYSDISQTNIFNSTFADNKCNYLFDCPSCYDTKSVNLSNNTIARNISNHSLYRGYHSNTSLINNTFIGNINEKLLLYYADGQLIGNILFGNINGHQQASTGDGNEVSSALASYNNVMALDTSIYGDYVLSETNIISDFSFDEKVKKYTKQDFSKFKNHIDDVVSLFEGTYDPTTGLFTPVLKDNGGFTPTVALKSDKLSDGRSIRFPRLENVLTDQRGVSRFDETCMGAYELGCVNDTTFTTDTIYVGEKILGQTFTKVGVHDSIFETLKSSLDCDSVVMHRVVVKPDPKTFNYYVKMTKEGRGDGSDWDNAMDSIDFATYLPLAPDGATFYVAAGTYKPVYDVNMNIPSDLSDLCYAINSSVTIRGGYPADAKGKDVPSEPKKYHTVFDGDIDGDDEISETKDNDYLSVSVTNRKDNSSYMFFSQSNKELHVGFDGISVKNSGGAVYILKSDKNVKISNSEFTYNDNAVYMPYEGENLEVYNSKFSKNFSNVIYMPTASNLTMDSILFENNQSNLVNIPGPSGVNPNHNVRLNRIYAYANGDSSAIVYSIGHDFALSNSEFKNNRGLFYIIDNTRIDSTLFESNYGDFTKYGVLGFEINECSFVDNRCNETFINTAKNGTEYNHFSLTNSTFKNVESDRLMNVITDSVVISNNEILDNKTKTKSTFLDFDISYYCEISNNNVYGNEFDHCEFIAHSQKTPKIIIGGNSIWNNTTTGDLMHFSGGTDPTFYNNTIVSNKIDGEVIYNWGSNSSLYNNTIVGNELGGNGYVFELLGAEINIDGNIILGNKTARNSEMLGVSGLISLKNNILSFTHYINSGDCMELPDNTNVVSVFNDDYIKWLECEKKYDYSKAINRNEEILTTIFEGTYDSETNLFTPVLADNGGFTPTVALKSDKLSDGTSIRFPRLENVLTDQRGVERFD